ncbi:hypothetical protein HW555_009972 [Spodoptera exigua]|uniref:Uncharacterized protein n=1 Tax=Spodoptera exigua TaxID=7107 RepID=A0A835G842_SPOEX|nr:hypothetical protein HW555_009972 [Spodoptera exigua]
MKEGTSGRILNMCFINHHSSKLLTLARSCLLKRNKGGRFTPVNIKWPQCCPKVKKLALPWLWPLEPADFRNYLRMDSRSFDILLNLVTPYIQKQNTVLRDSISAKQRLVVTLRFLATGNSYQDLKYSSLISQPMLSIIIPETCSAIYTCLEHYIKEPDYITRKWIDHENTSQGSIRHGDWRKHTDGLTSLKNTSKSQRNEEGNQVRNTFMNYFNSVGRVAFQDKMINAALEQDRKRKRRYWVHPLNTKRISSGQFHCLYATLREYPSKFIQFYRMSVESFDELLTIVKCFITKNDTKFRCAITPEERLTITLRLNPDKSFEYYRMSIQSFDVLLNLTKDYITKQNTKLRTAIPPEERLTVTLSSIRLFPRVPKANSILHFDNKSFSVKHPVRASSLRVIR